MDERRNGTPAAWKKEAGCKKKRENKRRHTTGTLGNRGTWQMREGPKHKTDGSADNGDEWDRGPKHKMGVKRL